jgi:hypothetical protein
MPVVGLIEADRADHLRYSRLQGARGCSQAAVVHDGRRLRQQLLEFDMIKAKDAASLIIAAAQKWAQEDARPSKFCTASYGSREEGLRPTRASARREHQWTRASP